MKSKKRVYRTKTRSLLHKFFKEEGFTRRHLAIDLNIAEPTLDKYLEDPTLFRVSEIRTISDLTELDLNFIFELIYEDNEFRRI